MFFRPKISLRMGIRVFILSQKHQIYVYIIVSRVVAHSTIVSKSHSLKGC